MFWQIYWYYVLLEEKVAMRQSRKRTFISLFLGLFVWAQLLSLCGAIESFNCASLDDIDPEDIVTMDPFLCPSQLRADLDEAGAVEQTIAAGICCFVFFLTRFLQQPKLDPAFCNWKAPPVLQTNRIWLRQRHLLL